MKNNKLKYCLITILGMCCFFIIYQTISIVTSKNTKQQLKNLNYQHQTIKLIIEYDLTNYLVTNELYSKTLEVALLEGTYIADNFNDYINFEYKDYPLYIEHLNCLKEIGYRHDEINQIFEFLEPDAINTIIDEETTIPRLVNYITEEYFQIKMLKRYLSFKDKNPNYNYEKVINYVNMNLDQPFYEKTNKVINPDQIDVLVNKYHYLSSSFIPKGLEAFGAKYAVNNNLKAQKEVVKAFKELANDAFSINLTIKVVSAYRSYESQQTIYKKNKEKDGAVIADTYSARPGHSEHQTGLALDVYNGVLAFTNFDKTLEYAWVKNNAHRYGFIIRYPLNQEHITGYKYEPWHLRYVGIDIATYIFDNNLTFDEYHSKFIKNK